MTIVNHTIVPRARRYWIEAIAQNGSRRRIEGFDTEDAAVKRLREIQAQEGIIDRWNAPSPPARDKGAAQ